MSAEPSVYFQYLIGYVSSKGKLVVSQMTVEHLNSRADIFNNF